MINSAAKLSKLFFPVLFALILCGCQKSESSALPASPFSDAAWEYTAEDVMAYEGSEPSTRYTAASAILIPKLTRNARGQSNICLMTRNG